MGRSQSARKWLRANGYEDIADMIDDIMSEWRLLGKRTRRDWWIVLAGTKTGAPCTYAGRTFPVLRVAQLRRGMQVTSNALARAENESAPEIWRTPRWPKRESLAAGIERRPEGVEPTDETVSPTADG